MSSASPRAGQPASVRSVTVSPATQEQMCRKRRALEAVQDLAEADDAARLLTPRRLRHRHPSLSREVSHGCFHPRGDDMNTLVVLRRRKARMLAPCVSDLGTEDVADKALSKSSFVGSWASMIAASAWAVTIDQMRAQLGASPRERRAVATQREALARANAPRPQHPTGCRSAIAELRGIAARWRAPCPSLLRSAPRCTGRQGNFGLTPHQAKVHGRDRLQSQPQVFDLCAEPRLHRKSSACWSRIRGEGRHPFRSRRSSA
jgi:hypothetical protein